MNAAEYPKRIDWFHRLALLEDEWRTLGKDVEAEEILRLKKISQKSERLIQLALKDHKEMGKVTYATLSLMAEHLNQPIERLPLRSKNVPV